MFLEIIEYLCRRKAALRPAAGVARHERKVRAAQDTPLVKVPAVGDSWIREKRMTAPSYIAYHRLLHRLGGKGEKVG